MGVKGQSQSMQTYSPNPLAGQYIGSALSQAQNAANLPFSIGAAPVAGFSPDQLSAFNSVNQAQGIANPYINQAANYFQQGTQPNVSAFFNPFAGAVGAQLQNIFGQQQVQNNANLVQSAGGVGADRIAVGQGNLSNQQALAAGQTFANLYAPSLGAAQQQEALQQGAGYGTAALGSEALNTALTGAQAQLGTGSLQQQLQQAQLNSPYQLSLARAAFPYAQSQFLTGAVGALAPGLGGTTQGTYQPAQPSIWSQLLGAGVTGAGLIGGTGGFGSNGWLGKLFAAQGGAIHNPYYDDGGEVDDATRAAGINALRSEMIHAGYMPDTESGEPYRLAGPAAMDAWRQGAPVTAAPASPAVATRGVSSPDAETPVNAVPTAGTSPTAGTDTAAPTTSFAESPWLPLVAAGLGIMGGTSPFAGVNIGQGGLQGIKALETQKAAQQKQETIQQAADRLDEEVKQHQAELGLKREELGFKEKMLEGTVLTDDEAKAAADIYAKTGMMPPMGYGPAAAQNRAKVLKSLVGSGTTGEDIVSGKAGAAAQIKATRDFATGQQGNTIRSFDVATQHLNMLSGLVTALNNGDTQAFNRIGNAWKTQTGNPAPTNFDAAKNIVADEITKAILGSRGALGDRQEALASVSAAQSPQQLMGVINTYKGLMSGQLVGLKKQYEDTTKKSDFLDRLSPDTKDALINHATSASPPMAVPPPSGREVGKIYQTPKGPHRWNGSGWEPVQ